MQFGFEFLITQKIEGYRGLLLGAEFYEGVTVSSRGHLKEWVGFEYRSASKLYGIFVSVSSEMAQRKLQFVQNPRSVSKNVGVVSMHHSIL